MEQKFTLRVVMQKDEYWWGGCVFDGYKMPYHHDTTFVRRLSVNDTPNQAAPFLLSNQGRYIWCDEGFDIFIDHGIIEIYSDGSEPSLYSGYANLKDCFCKASEKHFPPSGTVPPLLFFEKPQYNTWIELMYNQNQKDILEYAQSIIDNGMPTGLLMIDCGWSEYYGKWDFHAGRFPEPKKMVAALHQMGFAVMLWICPFVSPDSVEYRYLRDRKLLVMHQNGEPAIKKWWDGYSAVLDFTNPETTKWFDDQTAQLTNAYGIDGFKFDAGDAIYYSSEDQTYAPTSPNGQSELWALYGLKHSYNEYRACFKCAGKELVQRLCDKQHSWGEYGISALLPDALSQGIIGYAFSCPDMIGGGDYLNFLENSDNLDQELFVRYAQCAALMPMMQFSAAPWRVLDHQHFDICKRAALLHVEYSPLFKELAEHAAKSGEPIIRLMDYTFPGQGMENVTDQFMLGDHILVAPVLKKDDRAKTIHFPSGEWTGEDGKKIQGPCIETVKAELDCLPIFRRAE